MGLEPTTSTYDLIVVGAGISGLSLASRAASRGRRVLVVEKSEEVGGCLATARVQSGPDLFWQELGAHTCYNSYTNLISLFEERGLVERILGRSKLGFFLLAGGQIRSIPSQLGIFELLASVPRLFTASKAGHTVASYYGPIVGSGNYDRVFSALFDAVACQDTREFAVEFLFKKRPSRRKDFHRSFTLSGGLKSIAEALAGQLGVAVETGSGVDAVSRTNEGFSVRLESGQLQASRAIALAVPPPEAARLVAPIAPEAAELLSAIRVNPVYSVGVAVPRARVALRPLAGIVSSGDRFYSVVSRDVVPHPTLRGFTFHFRDDDMASNLRRIEEVLGVPRADFQNLVVRENALPSLGTTHAERTRRLDAALADAGVLLAGNYFLGLSIEDCVTRSFALAAQLDGLLSRRSTVEA